MSEKVSNRRSQEIIERELYKIRWVQLGSGMSDPDFFKLIAMVFNLTGGSEQDTNEILGLVGDLRNKERIRRES